MLAHARNTGEQVTSAPAAVWWNDTLWLAYRAVNGRAVLRSVDVLGDGSQKRHEAAFACGETAALAAPNDRLHLITGTAGGTYEHRSTLDGVGFSAVRPLPISDGFIGPSAFTAYSGGLAVLWAENIGGQAHLLTSADDGSTWQDALMPFSVQPEPAICADPVSGGLLVAYGDRAGGEGSFTIALVDPAGPFVVRRITAPTPGACARAAICATNYHNHPGLHVAAQERSQFGNGEWRARSGSNALTEIGEPEDFGGASDGLSLVFDGTHAWVAWKDYLGGDLSVGPYATTFDLPLDLRAKLGTPCDPAGCPPDPRLVCAATDVVEWQIVPPIIHNARRGDLILTPGDGVGLIGALLGRLRPPQTYDHMGIMIGDHTLIRHATMAHDRLQRRNPGRFMTGEFFGERAPADGFRPDALTYGWPGTITQSVEDAFFTGFNTFDPTGRPFNRQGDFFAHNPGVGPLPRPAADAPRSEWEAWTKQQLFADPEYPSDSYPIHNLPNLPAYVRDTGQTIEGIVVKPPPELEARDPRIRQVLHRVAAAAETIDGHYRFYAYTSSGIALDSKLFGPAATDPIWEGRPPGAAWAAGTRPVVCSSFVWAAIQLANAAAPGQRIELEGSVTEDPEELLASPSVDGLYRYLSDEREQAGQALHELLVERVRKEVYQAVQELKYEERLPIDLTTIGITALLGVLAGPAAAAVALLGLTPENIANLKLLFEDMPDDVATQMCNTFAKDRADETDERLWESPGEGLAVSPDDIRLFWDPPTSTTRERIWHGLYGHAERLLLTPSRPEPRRVHQWDRSRGPALVTGTVRYRDIEIEGATVRFGCETTMTRKADRRTGYTLAVSAGRYEAFASAYWPDTNQQLTGRVLVEVEAGDQPGPIDILLEDPPEWRRLLSCTGRIDTVRRVLVGEDDWAHATVNAQATLTWAPETWGPPPDSAFVTTWSTAFIGDHAQRFNVRVDMSVTLRADLSLEVTVRSMLCENYFDTSRPPAGDQIVTTHALEPFTVAPGGSSDVKFDHVSGNFPPDRGHVEFTIRNLTAPA
jgi:hypothetical protein